MSDELCFRCCWARSEHTEPARATIAEDRRIDAAVPPGPCNSFASAAKREQLRDEFDTARQQLADLFDSVDHRPWWRPARWLAGSGTLTVREWRHCDRLMDEAMRVREALAQLYDEELLRQANKETP